LKSIFKNRFVFLLFISNSIFAATPPEIIIESEGVVVETITISELKDIVSNRQGKPLLINIWATWCAPCREEFPELIQLAINYKNKIDVIGISVDFPEEIDTKIIPFLEKQITSFTNYVIDVNDPQEFIILLSEDWNGAIPATFIYNTDGDQISKLIGMQSYKSFENAIQNVID
jgi:thiol-disulfide isomerase/thioredoxin